MKICHAEKKRFRISKVVEREIQSRNAVERKIVLKGWWWYEDKSGLTVVWLITVCHALNLA